VEQQPVSAPESSFPTLLNAAHRRTTALMQRSLARSGFADLPVTGFRIAVLLGRGPARIGELASSLEVSKQATSRVVELLVQRGYCDRVADPDDRRSGLIVLTRRGRRAVTALRAAVEEIDRRLATLVDGRNIAAARLVLWAVADMDGSHATREDR
jgi:DNA-binding MarR family transcriptional regulator